MRPVVFPHWFHRIRYRCKVCHADLGFKFKAGGNEINMVKVIDGQFCGACHNGEVAWSIENCNMCHSAKSGTPTQVHESTTTSLVAPARRQRLPRPRPLPPPRRPQGRKMKPRIALAALAAAALTWIAGPAGAALDLAAGKTTYEAAASPARHRRAGRAGGGAAAAGSRAATSPRWWPAPRPARAPCRPRAGCPR